MAVIRVVNSNVINLNTLTINDTDSLLVTDGNQEIDAGMTQPGGSIETLTNLTLQRDFSGFMGRNSALLAAVTGRIRVDGGSLRYTPDGGTGGTLNRVEAVFVNTTAQVSGVGQGVTGKAHVMRGRFLAAEGMELEELNARGGFTQLQLHTGGEDVDVMRVYNAQLFSERGIDGAGVSSFTNRAQATFGLETTATTGLPAITTGEILVSDSNFDWRGGGINSITVLGDSILDFSSVPASMTVGTLTIDAQALAVARLSTRIPDAIVTITNLFVICGEEDTEIVAP